MNETIFYIANVRLPTEKAHGLQIMKTCEALAARGVTVELIVPRRHNPIPTDPFAYYRVEKNFTVKRLFCLDAVRFGRIGFWLETLSFLIAAKLHLVAKKGIVYTRDESAACFFKRCALELHTLPRDVGVFRKRLWQKTRKLFVLTALMQEELIRRGIAADMVTVLPDAVDIKEFDISISKEAARKRLALPLERHIALYTGSFFLYPWKGIDTFLGAARSHTDMLFVAVGGSEQEIRKARDMYTAKNIVFAGHKPHAEIPYYLKAADVLVLPNKGGYEMSERHTSPLKLFEYMAAGRPIVSSDLPSIREVLSLENAYLFEAGRSDALMEGILAALSDPAAAQKRAQNALERVRAYTWEARAQRILSELTSNIRMRG